MSKTDTRVTKFCFTLNNYTPEEYQSLVACSNKCKFLVIGKEIGANGTPHLQGYANLVKQSRFSAIKKFMPRAHIEKANGSDHDNLNYCTKQDKNAYVWGEPQTRGKRNDLKKATDMVLAKAPMAEVARQQPEVFVKYNKGLKVLAETLEPDRKPDDPPTTLWLWGESGVGKTRFAYDQLPAEQIYIKDGTQWWDGYTHQQCILIDDFDGRWPFKDLLRLLDRYPYQGQFKGGYCRVNSPIIIITCEFPPSHFWFGSDLKQVMRRLEYVQEITQ